MFFAVLPESGISDGWILDHVTPNMARSGIPRQVCLVLGKAMLWCVFDSCGDDLVPSEQSIRIFQRYEDLGVNNLLPVGATPVRKIPLVVDGYDSEVLIDQIVGDNDNDETNNPALMERMGLRRQEIRLLASQVTHLRRELADSRVEHERQLQVRLVGDLSCYLFCSVIFLLTIFSRCSVVSSQG